MLASHNSCTYLKPKWFFFNWFKNLWRCQDLSFKELYNKGVRYFDIRVRWNGSEWKLCHGVIDLCKGFLTLDNLCFYMKEIYPDCQYRLMLEKGDSTKFISEINDCINKYLNLMWVLLKKPWTEIFTRANHLPYYDFAYENWNWKTCLKSLFKNLIKENRFKDLDKAKSDNTHIYFVDYIE